MNRSVSYLILLALGALLFLPFLGAVHLFDWDEINFAESAREMLESGNFSQVQINFKPFWEKPPFFIWLQALSMSLFGVNEMAARLPVALAGIITLFVIFRLGTKYFSNRMAWIWVFTYLGSITPQLYFKTGLIDPWYNLFIFLGVMQLAGASFQEKKKRKISNLLAGAFIGLALLTKGPVALLIAILCAGVILLVRGFRFYFDWLDLLLFALACAAVSFVWYGMEILKHGFWFITEFLRYQRELASESVASHGQPWYYHPLVLLFGAFPASVIAMRSLGEVITKNEDQKAIKQWNAVLFWVTLILFSIVKTKIIHYSSLCWLPLTFLAALVIDNVVSLKIQFRAGHRLLLLFVGLVVSLAFLALPLVFSNPSWKAVLVQNMKDPFAVAMFLQEVEWPWYTFLPGICLLLAVMSAFIFLRKGAHQQWMLLGFGSLLSGVLLAVQLFGLLLIPRIERYTQGPAIDFLKKHADEGAYFETLGYKSYAQYFYGKVQPPHNRPDLETYLQQHAGDYSGMPSRDRPALIFRDWLLHGTIDKPAYFLCKIQHEEEFSKIESLEKIGKEGGFVFFKRKSLSAPVSAAQP